MKFLIPVVKSVVLLAAIAAMAFTTSAFAAKPGGGCNRNVRCPLVWAPVICDDGKTYSNQCFADKACGTGCEPTGDI